MESTIPLVATAIFVKTQGETFRLIIPPYQPLPLLRRHHLWPTHDNATTTEIRLYHGLTDFTPLGKWRISEIPPLPRDQASITIGVHLDQAGQLTVTANWHDQPLRVIVSSYGAIGQMPVSELATEALTAQGRGTIECYDAYREYGRIAVEGSDLLIPFAKPVERDSGLQLFQPGDQVTFAITQGQVTQVRMTTPHDPRYNHFWCDHCHKSLEYRETTEAYRDGTWGEYRVWTCNTCHTEVRPETDGEARL
jgi:hypothetical protein